MRGFLCTIDETIWDSVENGWVRPTTPKVEWDKAALALANANGKAINAIFCGVLGVILCLHLSSLFFKLYIYCILYLLLA